MAVTRINNNQISDASAGNAFVGINAAVKLQNYSITATKIANNLTYGSDLTITGNLTVQGNTTTIDTTYTTIEDPILLLASNQTGTPSVDIGFVGQRGTSNNVAFVWDESADEFVTVYTTTGESNTVVSIASYADIHSGNANIGGNIVVNGTTSLVGNVLGNINGNGNINYANGYFTGNVTVVGTFQSTSNIVANASGIFYGNAVTGNSAIFAGIPAYTPLGSNVVAQFAGNANSYSQINFQNISNGTLASTDFIATADNGNDSTNYIDVGINSSTFNDPVNYPGFGPNDAYVHNHGGNLILNPESSGKVIKFMVGGTGNSNVIGNITTTGLNITGTISASGNITGGNLLTGGLISATSTITSSANITGGNLLTGGLISATSNITGGNLLTSGQISSTGNITSASNIAGGNLAVTGTITSATLETTGNVLVGGNLTVQGNIQYINVDDLRVEDPVIIMGTGPNGAPLTTDDGMDRGIYMEWYKTGRGNSWIGWDNSSGNLVAAADVNFTGNNIINVNTYGTFQAGNIYGQSAVTSGNITGGNLLTAGLISSTGNITSAANILGANIISSALVGAVTVSASGNVTGGNLLTGGLISSTGNITSAANIAGGNLIATTTVSAPSHIGTIVSVTGNVTGGNLLTGGLISSTGNITSAANVVATNLSATGNITGANINTGGSNGLTLNGSNVNSNAGRITINSSDADVDFAVDGSGQGNVFYVDAGTLTASFGNSTQTTNAIVAFNATNSILMPVGNTLQRPATGVTGMLRFNSTLDAVEVYDSDSWTTVGTPSFTVVTDDQFTGNGSQTVFTLANAYTTNSVIVSINGVIQIPTSAYSVANAVLTFTEAPQAGDLIDVRGLTTTTQVVAISNSPGTAVVQPNATLAQVDITGNLIPTANVTYNLGSSTARWKDLFLSGTSMTLGNIVMKNTSGNTVAFYGPDGTTPATIDSTNVDTTTITNGTSNVSVASSGGNVRFNIGGTSNVMVVNATGAAIVGDLSVTGNATLSGNILGDRIQNGTTQIDIQTQNGNANISVSGTSNVAVFASTGMFVTGVASVSGNITGGNLSVGTGTITVNNIINGGSNGVGNIGSASTYFNTVFAKATSAQYADLAENYCADAEYAPGTVLSFGGEHEVTVSAVEGDRRIAGVVSTNPSYIMNSTLDCEFVATVALTGRVPTMVSGPVVKGDMMVSAGNGRAIACATPAIGTVIGKALENHASGDGVIEVVVGRL